MIDEWTQTVGLGYGRSFRVGSLEEVNVVTTVAPRRLLIDHDRNQGPPRMIELRSTGFIAWVY